MWFYYYIRYPSEAEGTLLRQVYTPINRLQPGKKSPMASTPREDESFVKFGTWEGMQFD